MGISAASEIDILIFQDIITLCYALKCTYLGGIFTTKIVGRKKDDRITEGETVIFRNRKGKEIKLTITEIRQHDSCRNERIPEDKVHIIGIDTAGEKVSLEMAKSDYW